MNRPPKKILKTALPWSSDKPLPQESDAFGAVLDSLDKGSLDLFNNLDTAGRQFVVEMIQKMQAGDSAMLEALYAVDYDRMPVEPHVFFTEADYMGHMGKSLYKAWWGHLLKCADPLNHIYEVILTGSLGTGKTNCAMLLMAYKIYRLTCLKDPAAYYKLSAKSLITFGIYSLTIAQAEDVGFYKLKDQMLDCSPYFKEVMPRSPYGSDYMEWPQKSIKVIVGSTALHAIGRDLLGVCVDEMNFHNRGKSTAGKAQELASSVSRRLETRFMSGLYLSDMPGFCVYVSSKKAETDFVETRIKKVKGLPGVHIVDGPIWEFLAGDKINYCGRTFRVLIGDATHDPQILDDVEIQPSGDITVEPALSTYEEARLEGKIIDVPVEHYRAFAEDILGAIRDVAGIATAATFNFFPRKKIIKEMFEAGKELPKYFRSETIIMPLRSNIKLTELFDLDLACAVVASRRVPFRHPHAPRYLHIDLARKHDAVGIVMVHPSEFTIQRKEEVQGTQEDGVEKLIEVDFAIRIKSDDSGEDINFNRIEEFVVWLKNNGFWLRKVTLDSYQSASSIQAFRTFGIDAGVRSVDKSILPYRILSRAINGRKVSCPFHSVLSQELGELIYQTDKDKVDHPANNGDGTKGSKDVSDALSGSVYECIIDKLTPSDLPPAPISFNTQFDVYLPDIAEVIKLTQDRRK